MKNPVLKLLAFATFLSSAGAQSLPIVFVTQVPPRGNRETVTSIGNNHLPTARAAPRGGDLMIRYSDNSIRYLTHEAGYGVNDQDQGPGAIAVRDPHIHWSGQRILFSMVLSGAEPAADRWQMYEATGFEQGAAVQITRVPNQPVEFNNVQPCYAPDDRIIYVSDRTRDGSLATYPALDEKSQGRINTGLWSLNPQTAEVFHMEHSPSGSFDPVVDSFGRVLFTRWDHLQRDEQAGSGNAFDYSSEAASATFQPGVFSESFPESLTASGAEFGLQFDLFMPWTVNPDGTDLVTLNHVGRHEFSPFAARSRPDANLIDMMPPPSPPVSNMPIRAGSLMQLTEHPTVKGRFFGTDALLTGLSAGRIVSIPAGGPTVNPSSMRILLTSGNGFLRDPMVLTNGRLVASVATGPNIGDSSYSSGGAPPAPQVVDPNTMLPGGNPFLIRLSQFAATTSTTFLPPPLVAPIARVFTNDDDGSEYFFVGPLWQLQPVEVRPATRPAAAVSTMDAPEREMFISAGVSPLALKSWLRSKDLAMMTVRNVTQRDGGDHQQPTNLAVQGGVSSVKADGGPTYTVKALQVLQGEYLRGYTADPEGPPVPGRRIKATALRSVPGLIDTPAGLPEGSATVAADGSVAALVPARRATSWQLIGHDDSPVVRERYWLSFQAGEIRSCTSCHGVNTTDQTGGTVATNPPAALRSLLETVKQSAPQINETSTFRIWSEAAHGVSLNAVEDDDADGTANMIEWGMGSSPVNAAEKPVKPLSVSLVKNAGGSFASVSFSRSTTEAHSGVIVEGSSDMNTWRTVASFGATTAVHSNYTLSRIANAGGKTENIALISTVAAGQSPDRYYRLRVTVH